MYEFVSQKLSSTTEYHDTCIKRIKDQYYTKTDVWTSEPT